MEELNSLDIDKMFAEAAGAAENTGEKDPEGYGKNPKKVDNKNEVKVDSIPKKEAKPETPKEQEKPKVEKPTEKPVEKSEVEEPIKDRLGPLLKSGGSRNVMSEGLGVNSIQRVLEMKEIMDNYNATELKFVKGYFQSENGSPAEIIYKALTTNTRGLDALNKIVIARGNTAADRAFYLMELDYNSIEAIYEQVDLLTGELGDTEKVSEINKIQICRTLEKTISEMPADVFIYINKLQEFTNKAIS